MRALARLGFVLTITCIVASDYEDYKNYLLEQAKNETFVKLFAEHAKIFSQKNVKKVEFPCVPAKHNKTITTSVHQLTPYDVKVIGAIGDSLTAGTGVKALTVLGLLVEDRGMSWSIGGDADVNKHITLPNMIKVYNSKLVGQSTGFGGYKWKNSHLNLAIPGDKAVDMPYQTRLLIERMQSGKEGVDFYNDWKVITMFIGGNDLCAYCKDREKYSVENYIGYIRQALDMLHNEVPKAFVNIVEVLNVGLVSELNIGPICQILHHFLCKCGAYPGDNRAELQQFVNSYQDAIENLIDSGRYDTRDDFTVVNQPFFSETQLPKKDDGSADLSFFSPDCFHLSNRGHEAAAYALWDNMIEPVGKKRKSWRPGVPVECPKDEAPYFYTKRNSPPANTFRVDVDHEEASKSEKNTTGTTVAWITVGALCFVALVVGYAIFKKKKANNNKIYQKI